MRWPDSRHSSLQEGCGSLSKRPEPVQVNREFRVGRSANLGDIRVRIRSPTSALTTGGEPGHNNTQLAARSRREPTAPSDRLSALRQRPHTLGAMAGHFLRCIGYASCDKEHRIKPPALRRHLRGCHSQSNWQLDGRPRTADRM
jgi:hypothetical protein